MLSANLHLGAKYLVSGHVWMATLDRPRPTDARVASSGSLLTNLRSLEPCATRERIA